MRERENRLLNGTDFKLPPDFNYEVVKYLIHRLERLTVKIFCFYLIFLLQEVIKVR